MLNESAVQTNKKYLALQKVKVSTYE